MSKPILIVGAGPTGMMLATWLHSFKVPFKLIDKCARRSETSRAMAMHSRTLEFYRQLGIAHQLIERGVLTQGMQFNQALKPIFSISLAQAGEGLSEFPYILSLPQDIHEAYLESHLLELGCKIERDLEVISVNQDDSVDGVEVRMRRSTSGGAGEEEIFEASYVIGCDGAHSAVRGSCNVTFEGGTYARRFYVADVELEGELVQPGYFINFMNGDDYTLLLPLPKPGCLRVAGMTPESMENRSDITFDDVRPSIIRNSGLEIHQVNWFSHYKVHHRVVSSFRDRRVFLAGDAAHVHSPVGGQGMNTGLGDATNLAWKLATVYHLSQDSKQATSAAIDQLLDSYNTERIAFAKTLISTTDNRFTLLTGNNWKSYLLRRIFFPYVIPFLQLFFNLPRFLFVRNSQISITYRDSRLSEEIIDKPMKTKTIAAGDRLPFIKQIKLKDHQESLDNHHTLTPARWLIHIYGETPVEVKTHLFDQQGLKHFYQFDWSEIDCKKPGLIKDALYLIRPDGHIGLYISPICLLNDDQKWKIQLDEYCKRWGVLTHISS